MRKTITNDWLPLPVFILNVVLSTQVLRKTVSVIMLLIFKPNIVGNCHSFIRDRVR